MKLKKIFIFNIILSTLLLPLYLAGANAGQFQNSVSTISETAESTIPSAAVSSKITFPPESVIPDYPVYAKQADVKNGKLGIIKGKIRLVGSGRSQKFVVTVSNNFEVTIIAGKDGFEKLMKYQGRQAIAAGRFTVRELKYPNTVYNRTVYFIEPEVIGF